MTLAEQTARARWPGCDASLPGLVIMDDGDTKRRWDPEHNEAHCAELIEEAKIGFEWSEFLGQWSTKISGIARAHHAPDRKTAICLAYLAWAEQRGKT